MTIAGRHVQKGIASQNWAAMAIFLQYVGQTDFRFIGLEGEKLEDFHLVFADGKKIIGESKSYTISFPEIKGILKTIIAHGQVTKQDEILIACTKVDKNLNTFIDHLSYYDSETKEKIASQKNIDSDVLELMKQVRFWEISQEMAKKISERLFARIFNMWIPNHRVSEVVREFYESEIEQGSQNGSKLSRSDFFKKIETKKNLIYKDEGYDKKKVEKEKELEKLLTELENPSSPQWAPNRLIIISDNPDEHYWILKLLEAKKELNLEHWDRLFRMSFQSAFVLEVFTIFKKPENISLRENQDYFITTAPDLIEQNSNFFREDFIHTDIAEICKIVLESTRKHDEAIFEIVKMLFEPSISRHFYKKSNGQDYTYEWEKISELLLQLYESTKLKALREKIVDYIFSKFNLIEDEWKFWHYTPPSIFKIILLHFKSSPKDSISKLVPIFSNQFNQFYKQFGKQLEFKGWEHMGSGISQSGSEFSIQDRYFVGYILKPLILGFYEEDKDVCWKFLADHYIAPKIDDVSINKPDFMNRASLPVVFREYKDGIHTNEAYEVLSNFVRMRKGIPWKADLVFQELRGDYSDDQKWAVVKVSLEEFNNLPVNVFVEQIVADLAKKEHKEALKTIASWVGNPEYNRRQSIGSFSVMENIAKLLDNPKTFDDGVVIYTNYITSEEFVKKVNDWNTWDVAKILAKIITLKPDAGVKLLKTVISSKVLTENQQTLICSSVNNLTTDNKQLLDKVYQEFVLPLLQEQDYDIVKIEKRITNRHSREQLVQFAEKLAESTLWNEAFSIIKIFIDDSDPILGNYPEDEKGDFNEHEKVIAGEDSFTIRTVRGWCAWVLQKLFIPKDFSRISETRKIIEQALPLLEKLINDPNYYVRIQATVPLSALARNRNTVLPENPKERFISLEVAAKTKSLAFKMLKDPTNHKLPSVMKHLAMTFTYVRSLTQEEAWEVLQTFLKDEYPKKKRERGHESHIADVLSEAAPLYIFFAFYRAEAFKNWPKEWEDLGKFDDKPFKELLRSMLRNSNAEIRRVFTWQLARLPNEVKDKPEFESTLNLAADYLMLSTQKYDHSTFENIYRFIEDYIDKDNYFDICFRLWTACIKTEKKYFEDNFTKDKLQEMYWWPFFYNGKILLRILDRKGLAEFLKWLGVLVDYPIELYLANDLDNVVDRLVTIKSEQSKVEKLFSKLIERNSKYYEYKQKWLRQVTKK